MGVMLKKKAFWVVLGATEVIMVERYTIRAMSCSFTLSLSLRGDNQQQEPMRERYLKLSSANRA